MPEWNDASKIKLTGKFAWVTDCITIKLVQLYEFKNSNFYYLLPSKNRLNEHSVKFWLPIEEPELPEPKLHLCTSPYNLYTCSQSLNGSLRIAGYGVASEVVNFCPFCGFVPNNERYLLNHNRLVGGLDGDSPFVKDSLEDRNFKEKSC